jgi:CBS domain-containing protein
MTSSLKTQAIPRMTLCAETAADMMTPNPMSIRDNATVREAVALFTEKHFSAAPVIDKAGRPVGVLSQADIIVHDREKVDHLAAVPEYYEKSELTTDKGESLEWGFQVEGVDPARVSDLMTPIVFSVSPDTPATRVVEEMWRALCRPPMSPSIFCTRGMNRSWIIPCNDAGQDSGNCWRTGEERGWCCRKAWSERVGRSSSKSVGKGWKGSWPNGSTVATCPANAGVPGPKSSRRVEATCHFPWPARIADC